MDKAQELDLEALTAAKPYMGAFAWPTVVLGLAVTSAYIAVPWLVVSGHQSLGTGVVLMTLLTYVAYTVLHEAVHGSISGSHASLRWVNDLMGYMAAWVLMIPLTAHRHEHLAHHRHTNEQQGDPDIVVADMTRSPLSAAMAGLRIFLGQYQYYLAARWSKAPRKQNVYFCLEVLAAVAPRVAFVAAGFWVEGLVLFGLAGVAGITLLMFLFAYVVHTPHRSVGRYVDTSTITVPGQLGKVVTILWCYQNYHSIHHLFPRIPFYHYRKLFGQIEGIMIARGSPVYKLDGAGLVQRLRMRFGSLPTH